MTYYTREGRGEDYDNTTYPQEGTGTLTNTMDLENLFFPTPYLRNRDNPVFCSWIINTPSTYF